MSANADPHPALLIDEAYLLNNEILAEPRLLTVRGEMGPLPPFSPQWAGSSVLQGSALPASIRFHPAGPLLRRPKRRAQPHRSQMAAARQN